MEDRELYELARRKVEAKIGFWIHFGIYVAVNSLLFFLDFRQNEVWDWSYFTLLGWGIGVLFHGLSVFVFSEGSPRREAMIAREVERRRRQERGGPR